MARSRSSWGAVPTVSVGSRSTREVGVTEIRRDFLRSAAVLHDEGTYPAPHWSRDAGHSITAVDPRP
jgi:hypothetical protein